jgi:uncharacterized membrane protein/mono/diheme cytochrome c family protein
MILDYLGKFHPLLVHLPIGFLFLAILLKLIDYKWPKQAITDVLPTIVFLSFISSIFTCITGYLLHSSGGYEQELVEKHQWLGIALTILTGIIYFWKSTSIINGVLWVILAVLLGITGHLGGSITHGEDFLSFKTTEKQNTKPAIADIQNAKIYEQIINPILTEKCIVCHSTKKQKGDLRLDEQSFISKGGKNGACIIAGSSTESLLSKRILLDPKEEKHMPPKGKPQLSEAEIKLINWWINEGANFKKLVKEVNQPENLKNTLLALQDFNKDIQNKTIPDKAVNEGDANAINSLKNLGVLVIPVGLNSNYLSVNLSGNKKIKAKDLELLLKLKDQIVWIKAADLQLGDSLTSIIGQLYNTTLLHLNGSNVNDNNLNNITKLNKLVSLNLTNTGITEKGVLALKNLASLNSLFLFNTKIKPSAWKELVASFAKTKLDSGGYMVPTLASDTVMLKYATN